MATLQSGPGSPLCAEAAQCLQSGVVAEEVQEAPPPAPERPDDDFRLGDRVVLMAEPGPFTVVELDPPVVTIESAYGQRRRVKEVALRRVDDEPPVNT